MWIILPQLAVGQTTIASDNASNYGGGWTSGSNQGTGFAPWVLTANGGSSGFAGSFIGNPSDAGVVGMNANSFGLFANPNVSGNFSHADRPFSEPLSVGRTFRFQWGVNWDSDNSDGSKGVILYDGGTTGTALITIEMSNSAVIRINGATMFANYGTNAMTISMERKSATEIRVYATGRNGTEEFDQTYSFDESISPDAVRFYAQRLNAGNERQPYLNNLAIIEVEEEVIAPGVVVLSGPADAANGVALRPTLSWTSTAGADSYALQVSTVSNFSSTVLSITGVDGLEFTFTSSLLMESEYFWRVRATNTAGSGDWSEVRSFTTVAPTATLRGNGGGGFGDVLGSATLDMHHDETHIYFQLNKGTGSFNDMLVIYLDTQEGGVTGTAGLTDVADDHRKGISGDTGELVSNLTFPTGFTADYAIAINTGFAGVWSLATTSNFEAVNSFAVPSSAVVQKYAFRVARSGIGLGESASFKLLATYLNGNNGFRSNESFSIGFGSSNPGTNPVSVRSFHRYPSGDMTADVRFFGQAGWRFLANPFSGLTLDNYVGSLWTQGFAGSDFPSAGAAASNVRVFDGSAYVSVQSQSDAMPRGTGFAVGIYRDDVYNTEGAFPKTITVTGTPSHSDLSPTLNGSEQFTLLGNPFPFSADFDVFTKQNISDVVYVYDYVTVGEGSLQGDDVLNTGASLGTFRSWNGTTGSLDGGHIAPFQGFLVYATDVSPSITMSANSRANPVIFRGKDVAGTPQSEAAGTSATTEALVAGLRVFGPGVYSEAFVHFAEEASAGIDARDAFKLYPFSSDYALMQTFSDNGVGLDINHYPIPGQEVVIPMDIVTTVSGTFTVRAGTWSLPAEWSVVLRDTWNGSEYTLGADAEVTLELEAARGKVRRGSLEAGLPGGFTPEIVTAEGAARFALVVSPGAVTSVQTGGVDVPRKVELYGNYPNPFNPVTRIQYAIPFATQVRLEVYDMLGRRVAVLVDGEQRAGSQIVNFDASALGSGVYIYRLEAAGVVLTRKMTLVK